MVWLPISFSLGNFSVLAVGVWAIAQRDSVDAVLMVSIVNSFYFILFFQPCDAYRSQTGAAQAAYPREPICVWNLGTMNIPVRKIAFL